MKKTGALIEKIKKVLSKHPTIKIAIIYGSHAKGNFTEKSDVDLAIAFSRKPTDDERVELILGLTKEIGLEIDLIDLNSANGTVFKQALTTGKVIILRDPLLLARIASRMLFEEADFSYICVKLNSKKKAC